MSKLKEIAIRVKNLFIKNQSFILLSVIVLMFPILISYIPYINLVYTIDKGILLYLLVALMFVRPSSKLLLIVGIILSLIALILLLLGFMVFAEDVGNVIFILIAVRIFYIIFAYLIQNK